MEGKELKILNPTPSPPRKGMIDTEKGINFVPRDQHFGVPGVVPHNLDQ